MPSGVPLGVEFRFPHVTAPLNDTPANSDTAGGVRQQDRRTGERSATYRYSYKGDMFR
jgi:hypothetical protein